MQTIDLAIPTAATLSYGQKAIVVAGPSSDESLRTLIALDLEGHWYTDDDNTLSATA